MQFIADNAAAISARLKELESEKAKARGGDSGTGFADGGATIPVAVGETFHFYGTPVVKGGCYQAPDDYCGYKATADSYNNPEVQWTPSGPYLPDAEPREIAKAMLKLCAPDDFMGYVEIGVMTDFGPTG